MLLKKIKTKGFLGHLTNENGDFVELDFADKNLWLIHGRNGAGKSSLFDAITMAFYKQHRGGKQHAEMLINDRADKAEIFVEFEFHGNDYRIAVDIPKKSTPTRRLQFWNGSDWETRNVDIDEWVKENLKLSYTTFVSSVLLQQGKADKFITEGSTSRRQTFLELMQLEFYKKLTERANNRKTNVYNLVKEKQQQLEDLENPSKTEINNQVKIVKQFKKELENLESENSAKQKELDDAKQAQKLKEEIKKIEAQQKLDAELFENSAQVEEKYNYFVELKENILHLESVWREKNEIVQTENEFQVNVKKLAELNDELKTNAEKLNENTSERKKKEIKFNELETGLTSLKTERDELKQKIDDIERIEKLEKQIEEASRELDVAQIELAQADEKIDKYNKQIEKKITEKEDLEKQLRECQGDFRFWSDKWENRRKVVDKDICPTCENELKSEEIRRKLKNEFEESERKVEELKQKQDDLGKSVAETKEQLLAVNEKHKNETANRQELSETKVASETKIETWKSQITVSYLPVQREKIRSDFTEIAKRFANSEAESRTTKSDLENIGRIIINLENTKISLNSDLQNIQQNQKSLLLRKQKAETGLVKAETQISEKWRTHAAFQDEAELEKLRHEQDDLRNIQGEYEKLKDARNRKANLEGQIETLSRQFQEIPENNRREVATLETAFNEIVGQIEVSRAQFDSADNLRRKMTEDKAKYDEKSGELKTMQKDLEIWKTLAKALGKDGLETEVVREARQKIENNANKTLQALSNGNFKLELADSGKEMKILVRDFTTGEQRQIEYFSGGEKFLTAVSLAVAIGQSASGQNIANTLIIDEGFGALDDKNRKSMAKEIARLSEVLQNGRVIIVSHQDDVQEEFANRFRLVKTIEGFINVQLN
ncbi:DNA double-strand break repair ATPase Rad50 [soil metagenome]